MRSKPVAGRFLGWTEHDLQHKPYAMFWNPVMQGLAREAQNALLRGPVAEPFLPPLDESPVTLLSGEGVLENGFALTANGAMHVAVRTEMPGTDPAMVDWWFGWHGDSAERYKLWHPQAHVHAQWQATPAAGSRGRARYRGQVSCVDEYVGSELGRFAIRFLTPSELGFCDATLDDGQQDTVICARVGLADFPVDVGYLVHHVRRTERGAEMRSRFWLGGPYATGRNGSLLGNMASQGLRLAMKPNEENARALLVHCAEEMTHLASFLPRLHEACAALD